MAKHQVAAPHYHEVHTHVALLMLTWIFVVGETHQLSQVLTKHVIYFTPQIYVMFGNNPLKAKNCLHPKSSHWQMRDDCVLDNVMLSINFLVFLLKCNWLNIQTLHAKTLTCKPMWHIEFRCLLDLLVLHNRPINC